MNIPRTCFGGVSSTPFGRRGRHLRGPESPHFSSGVWKTRQDVEKGCRVFCRSGWFHADGLLLTEEDVCSREKLPTVITGQSQLWARGSDCPPWGQCSWVNTSLQQGKPRGSRRDGWDGGMASVRAARGPQSGRRSLLANKLWVSPNYMLCLGGPLQSSMPSQHPALDYRKLGPVRATWTE